MQFRPCAVLTADGVLHDSFQIDLQSDIYRSEVKFRGNVNPDPGKLVLDGNLTVQSAQAQDLLAALRVPALSAARRATVLCHQDQHGRERAIL